MGDPVTSRRVASKWLLGFAMLLLGCSRPATQLVVVVESDYPVGVLERIEVTTVPVGAVARADDPRVFTLDDDLSLPFSFGVIPPTEGLQRVDLELRAIDTMGRVRVTRRVRTGFLPQLSLRLPVFLSSRCETVVCDPDETCGDDGLCVSVEVVESSLTPTTPGAELRDAGLSRDTGPRDTGPSDDAAVPMLEAPTSARGFAHSVGVDVRGLVRLSDGTLVMMSQSFSGPGGSDIAAYRYDGTTLSSPWDASVVGDASRPVVVGDGFVLSSPVRDAVVTVTADRTVTLTRPSELSAMGSTARSVVALDADGRVRWSQMLWAEPLVPGEGTQLWCGVCGLGSELMLTCRATEGTTLMLDDAPLALGPAVGGSLPAGSGGVILRATMGASGLENVRVIRWVSGTHDSYCTADDSGGFYASFRHTDLLAGLDRVHDPRGADTMTVARFDPAGQLLWSEQIFAARRNVSTPDDGYPSCYRNLTLAAAPSGMYFASWLAPTDDCIAEVQNGAGPYTASWPPDAMVIATLGADGSVSADRLRVSSRGGIAWALSTHPSGTVLLAGHVNAGTAEIFGLPFTVTGPRDGALLGLDTLGQPRWVVQATATDPTIGSNLLGVAGEPGGAIWIAGLHYPTTTGTVLGAGTSSRFLARLE